MTDEFVLTWIEVLPLLRHRYGELLRDDMVSVVLRHERSICFLEISSGSEQEDGRSSVNRRDLSFITIDGDSLAFDGEKSVFRSARMLVERLTAYDLINCTNLFSDEAAKDIDRRYKASTKS